MANREQLAILKQGVKVWNEWRQSHPQQKIDLSFSLLNDFNLEGYMLQDAILLSADFHKANLRSARLARANMKFAVLPFTDLTRADLSWADLTDASLSGANLNRCNFVSARLNKTDFTGANLDGSDLAEADLKGSAFGGTLFGRVNLDQAKGLENTIHVSPSVISTVNLHHFRGLVPSSFLKGCGLSDIDIEYAKLYKQELPNSEIDEILYRIHDLRANQAVQISPLFISYSHGDGAFVDKFEVYLNRKGIRFWRDVHDATAGRLEKQIDRAMRLNPTVLLILSKYSIKSDWVEHEVRTARELEKEIGHDVLCPIALDDSWKNSSWPKRVMEQVMEYNILDFSTWKNDSKFESIFNKLIDGLELFYK